MIPAILIGDESQHSQLCAWQCVYGYVCMAMYICMAMYALLCVCIHAWMRVCRYINAVPKH